MGIDWKGKKVAVLGVGVEGVSSAKYLVDKGAIVTVLDQKKEKEVEPETLHELQKLQIRTVFGPNYLDELEQYDVVVRSPGIPRSAEGLFALDKEQTILTSQTQIFFDACPCPIIGVTGTKGKGTTSSLIYEMLKEQGSDAYLGGNIGMPPFDFLDRLTDKSWVVLELSSFQLEDITKSPHIGVMLMVTQEHLGADTMGTQNFHATLEDYIEAKRNMLRFQIMSDFAILNRDYPASNESDTVTQGKVYHVSRERDVHDQGCFIKDNAVWLRIDEKDTKIIDIQDIFLPGKHNLENVCAAAMAAILAGVSTDTIEKVLKTFKGLEHRLEFVSEVQGVRYYDDSFSTIQETTIAAIKSFNAPEILILGGSSKKSDFTELGKVIRESKNIKAIIGIGIEWERMKSQFQISNFKFPIIEGATNMNQIVQAASKIAKPGDVVLLSPACASFDMFKNYKERGEQFKAEVKKL